VAQGLHRAHKENLVHRDVKPDNILVTADGIAKLADLGLVKETETDLNLTRTGRGLGTPHFMAPEQFRNAKNADIRCDIYSLGATLYQMVTGELPFRSNGPLDAWMKKVHNDLVPPRQIVPDLSERLDWAIRRAMSADPGKRPASCREFVEDLTGKSTRRLPQVDSNTPQQELWYLIYKDEAGTPHTVKGTVASIRRSLKDGLLGDAGNVRASQSKAGPFEPLLSYAEFRDLLVEAAPLELPKSPPCRRPPVVPPEDTVAAAQPLKQGSPQTPPPVAVSTPPLKPLITLKDVPPSTNPDVWKWVVFFGLSFLAAFVAYWFIPR
jgi:serine/threonine protein kinase